MVKWNQVYQSTLIDLVIFCLLLPGMCLNNKDILKIYIYEKTNFFLPLRVTNALLHVIVFLQA